MIKNNKIVLLFPDGVGIRNYLYSDVFKGMDYFKKVKKLYPVIKEYEHFVEGDEYFSSCGHLNDKGARLFTSKIIEDLGLDKNEKKQ